MKETEQTLLDQIKDQVIKEVTQGEYLTFQSADDDGVMITEEVVNLVANRFATARAKASCEATLKKASENAVVRGYCVGCERVGLLHCAHADSCGNNVVIVDKSSINHPSNIVIV